MANTEQASKGYPALAQLMAAGGSTAIFKRFAEMQIYSLLMQQAELLQLQEELQAGQVRNQTEDNDINKEYLKLRETEPALSRHNSGASRHNSGHNSGNSGASRSPLPQPVPKLSQWALQLKIRRKLKEYNKALLRFAEVENLPKPRSYDVDTLRKWYIREHGGNNFFRGFDEVDWANADKDNSDLVAATTRSFDITTRVTAEKIVPFFFRAKLQKKKYILGDENLGLVQWSDGAYESASRWLTVTTSAILPSLAIIVLYYIPRLIHRIVAATCFTFLFSGAVALLTSSRPPEIFAATVAFSAVEVVFIGSTGSNSTA